MLTKNKEYDAHRAACDACASVDEGRGGRRCCYGKKLVYRANEELVKDVSIDQQIQDLGTPC